MGCDKFLGLTPPGYGNVARQHASRMRSVGLRQISLGLTRRRSYGNAARCAGRSDGIRWVAIKISWGCQRRPFTGYGNAARCTRAREEGQFAVHPDSSGLTQSYCPAGRRRRGSSIRPGTSDSKAWLMSSSNSSQTARTRFKTRLARSRRRHWARASARRRRSRTRGGSAAGSLLEAGPEFGRRAGADRLQGVLEDLLAVDLGPLLPHSGAIGGGGTEYIGRRHPSRAFLWLARRRGGRSACCAPTLNSQLRNLHFLGHGRRCGSWRSTSRRCPGPRRSAPRKFLQALACAE